MNVTIVIPEAILDEKMQDTVYVKRKEPSEPPKKLFEDIKTSFPFDEHIIFYIY